MATKAEVETMARHIWYRQVRPVAVKYNVAETHTQWSELFEDHQESYRAIARWHLRKLKQAYNRGLDDVAGSGDYD